jgi:hypothetical protein
MQKFHLILPNHYVNVNGFVLYIIPAGLEHLNYPLVFGVIPRGYSEELLCNNGNYSGMKPRDIQSERG